MQKVEYMPVSKIKPDPKNPRIIKDAEFKRLCESIQEDPDYFETRPILVDKDMVIFAGNMRYKAAISVGMKEVPVAIMDGDEETRRRRMVRDNVQNGTWDWDILANEWESEELEEWGVTIPIWNDYEKEDGEAAAVTSPEEIKKAVEMDPDYSPNLGKIIYEPNNTSWKPEELFEIDHRFDDDIQAIQNPKLREFFKLRAANFARINYEKAADYYAYQATPDEQRVFERLALVLLDRDKLIENGFSKLINSIDDTPEEYDQD